jgi:hypothetical protein
MIKRPLAFYIPLAFAASLLFAGWYLRRPQQGIGAAFIFVPLGVVLTTLAIVYFRSAYDIAVVLEQRNANKHPIFRLWLPASFFRAKAFVWPLRVTGIIAGFLGLEFVALGILFLVRHQ